MQELDHSPIQGPGGIVPPNVATPNADLMASAFRCSPAVLHDNYGDLSKGGWAPQQRQRFGHLTPANWYESLLDAIVTPQTVWLDVGCGRNLSPGNAATERCLADRCL
jgi:hypothetical protein